MGAMVSNLSSNELLPALEDNMIAFWKPYGRGPGGELQESVELVRFISGSPEPLFNGIMGAHLAAERADEAIEETSQACTKHNVSALWWVGPGSQPADLGSRLERHGFAPAGTAPGMAVELEQLQANTKAIDGLSVQTVDDPGLLRLWSDTAWVGSGFPAGEKALFTEIETQMGIDASGLRRRYLGYWNGKPVGTSVLALHAGVAGIFAVSTLPAARGHGIGTALTVAPLVDARKAGYRVGTLQASDMGYPIYRKLGFKDVCQYKLYIWEKR